MDKRIFNGKDVGQILRDYNFTHRFYISFAYMCACDELEVQSNSRVIASSTKCLDLLMRFINKDPAVTPKLLKVAATDAYTTYEAYCAAYAALFPKEVFDYADFPNYRDLLLKFIDEGLTEFEKIMIFGAAAITKGRKKK